MVDEANRKPRGNPGYRPRSDVARQRPHGAVEVVSIATLRAESAGPFGVRGRVVLVDAARARIADESGTVDAHLSAGASAVSAGDLVEVTGQWDTRALMDATATVVTRPSAPFPAAGGDFVRMERDGRARITRLRQRAAVMTAIRAYFASEHFLEVETPLAVPSPGLDVHLDAVEARPFTSPRWLATSPEYQMKRLLVGGLQRIVQIGRVFRAGEVGARHQPEFTMLEWYRAFAGAANVMRDTEELVASVAQTVLGSTVIPGLGGAAAIDVAAPWHRLTIREAFRQCAGLDADALDDERFYRTLTETIEPKLGFPKPVFLTEWPARMASLARLCPHDATVAERFEAFVGGVELSNGFGELTDPSEQRARLFHDQEARRATGKAVYPIDERFLSALGEGMPPSGGNALGVDRLVMLVTGASDIREVLAFAEDEL